MKSGKDAQLDAAKTKELGLGDREVPLRILRYKQSISPDKKDHSFSVLYEGRDGEFVPKVLLVAVSETTKTADQTLIDLTILRASLKGILDSAIRLTGPIKDATVSHLEVNKVTERLLKTELDFFLSVAPSMNLEFAK